MQSDVRNVGLLLLWYAFVMALAPPARDYPMIDDWAYAQSVARLSELAYYPHDQTQPSSLAHLIWGVLSTALLGQSFTALTLANLTISVAGVIIFYFLLRQVGIVPSYSLLGAAMLACNPVYLFLSYSFMTDVTFVTYLLAACLCYVRGVQGYGARWLWLGSIMAALCFLTRQVGLVLVPAILVYLWWSSRLTLRSAVAAGLIPLMAAAAYQVWEQAYPTQLIAYGMQAVVRYATQQPLAYLTHRVETASVVLSALGLYLMPVLWLPRRFILAVVMFLAMLYLLVQNLLKRGTMFPRQGGVVDHSGFNMGSVHVAPVWSEWVWGALAVIGAALFSLFAAACWERIWAWLRSRPWKERAASPALLPYIVGVLLTFGSIVLSPYLFDRYLLPVFPLLVLFALRRIGEAHDEKPGWRRSWRAALLAPIALFSLLAQMDYTAHASARWEAGEQLVAQGTPINQVDAGFEWTGWHLYEQGARIVRQRGSSATLDYPPYVMLDPVFAVDDLLREGYEEVGSVAYRSWLSGGQTRYVLIQKRK